MIVASGIELRAGARLLLEGASFQVAAGDRIGLVGRNGAGKTTLAKVLAGAAQPAAGSVRRTGTVGYLPQDPRTGDLDTLAMDRVLSARGLDKLRADLRTAEAQMADPDSGTAARIFAPYGLDAVVLGGDKRSAAGLRADPRLAPYLALATDRFLTVPDPRLAVLTQTPRSFLAIRIRLTEPELDSPGSAGRVN